MVNKSIFMAVDKNSGLTENMIAFCDSADIAAEVSHELRNIGVRYEYGNTVELSREVLVGLLESVESLRCIMMTPEGAKRRDEKIKMYSNILSAHDEGHLKIEYTFMPETKCTAIYCITPD